MLSLSTHIFYILYNKSLLFFQTTNSYCIQNVHALRLQLFFVEVDTSNTLGSKIKNNGELGMFQFLVLNLPPDFNSLLFLYFFSCCICKSPLFKKNGLNAILGELMKEIKVLESPEGMLLEVQGRPGLRI